MKKVKAKKEKVITVKLEDKKLNEIDTLAEKLNLNRSQMVRNLVDSGLSEAKALNAIGILSMASKGYDLFEIVKKSITNKAYKVEDDRRLIIDLEQ